MSEYQYYEFQAIDRRLTEAQMQTLREYSTRATITPTSFVNEYHWGDFKGDTDGWMNRYFDAFVYFANWGTRILKLRLPTSVLDPKTARVYFDGDSSSMRQKGKQVILTFESESDGDDDCYDLDAESLLSSMLPVRAELAQGDQRALYLAWLASMNDGILDDDAIEPPVPAGLGELSGALSALAEFLRIDPDLLEVAARASAPITASPLQHEDVLTWLGRLPSTEKDGILTRLIATPDDAASVPVELLRRYRKARETNLPAANRTPESRRTVGELLRAMKERSAQREQAAARKAAERKAREEREAAAARASHLDRLVGHELRLWAEVDRLAATKLPKNYDQTVDSLIDLRDVADRGGAEGKRMFLTRLGQFRGTHARKPSLLERLDRAGL